MLKLRAYVEDCHNPRRLEFVGKCCISSSPFPDTEVQHNTSKIFSMGLTGVLVEVFVFANGVELFKGASVEDIQTPGYMYIK